MVINTLRTQGVSHKDKLLPQSPNIDWMSVILAWGLVLIVIRRLLVTNWTDDLYLIAYIANLAFLLGFFLGFSRFRRPTLIFFALTYGIFFIGWRLGLLQSSTPLWIEKVSMIFARLEIIFRRISINQPVYDNLLFLLLMMTLFWVIGLNTSYSLVRSKHVLRIIVPLFATLIVIHTYDPLIPSRNGYLYFFSFLAVLLIGRLFYLQQKEIWKQRQFYVPPQLSSEAFQFTIGVVCLLLVLAFLLPSNRAQLKAIARAWEKAKEPFQSLRKNFENAFSSLRVTSQIPTEFYERTLNLGRGNVLSEDEILTAIAQSKLPAETRLYWRSRVYDQYENGQWTVSEFSTRDIEANAFDVNFPSFPERPARLHSFTLYNNQPLKTLIFPAQPNWTNLAVQIEYAQNPDGSVDLFAIHSNPPLPIGKTYSARASLSSITEEQLRAAGEVYPLWVTERYLQLPDSLTERTKQLAFEITKDFDTPYEKTVAITEYLRSHITYVEMLEELPTNQEIIDWFLFDYQKGFCNYYATAEVLLLRSLGIPARLAVGFAEGTLEDLQTANVYVVRQRDAHAWPEVFFPNIGWIEFEPTSAQPALTRPRNPEKLPSELEISAPEVNPREILQKLQEKEAADTISSNGQPEFPTVPVIILLLVMLSLSIWLGLNRQRVAQAYLQLPEVLEKSIRGLGLPPPKLIVDWNQHTKLSPIEKSYQCINTALRILRDPAPAHYTPSERAAKLLQLLPEAEIAIREILQQYQKSLYGNANSQPINNLQHSKQVIRLARQKRLRYALMRLFNGSK